MTEEKQESQEVKTEAPKNDKEYNFRALEAKLKEEREARLEAERRAQEYEQRKQHDDDDYDEPYIDQKYFNKKLSSFEKSQDQKLEKMAEAKARQLIEQEKQSNWLKNNADFYDVMKHADKFAEMDPELAETILQMPNTFERQKLVYRNIKALGLDKPKVPEPSIQDKINANRKSPYYQPSSVGTAPYNANTDFSPAGQEQAYRKMKELQARFR